MNYSSYYADSTAAEAVLSYLEDHAPTKPKMIAEGTGKSIQSVYSALGNLKKAGKVKSLKGKGWTVVHRAPTKEVVEEKAPERSNAEKYREKYTAELNQSHLSIALNAINTVRQLEEQLIKKEGVIEYLEECNDLLEQKIYQLQQDLNQFAAEPQGE